MSSLRGKVMKPDGVSKLFKYCDVKDAVDWLKESLKNYWGHKLISQASRGVNDLIDMAFFDVTNKGGDVLV